MSDDPSFRGALSDDDDVRPVRTWPSDLLSSVVVFFVALPLCLGIAIASGVPIAAGLITGIVGGLVVGSLAGSPLQVSGPAAGLTVLVFAMVQKSGVEILGPVVLLAGALQIVAGAVQMGPWFRAVSPAVIRGMLAGIGVLIFASQFHVMIDDGPKKDGLTNLFTIPEAIRKGLPMPTWKSQEQRKFEADILHSVGHLRALQNVLKNDVHSRVTDHSTVEEAAAQAATIEPLVGRAEAMEEELQRLVKGLDDRKAAGGEFVEKNEDLRLPAGAAHLAAQKAVSDLKASLRSGRIEKVSDDEGRVTAQVRNSQDALLSSIDVLLGKVRNHDWASKVGIATILLIVVWSYFTPKSWRIIPAPLVAVVTVTALCAWLTIPVKTIELPAQILDGINLISWNVLKDLPFSSVVQGAVMIALIASAETLLCATAVDQMHQGPRTNYDRELMAQGVGNVLCGVLGGLPMTGVIVRSATNVQAGAKTRLSAVLHGAWLLGFVAFASPLLQMIPTSCLAGLLVFTGIKLMDFKAWKELKKFGAGEVVIFAATVLTIVSTDLLTGVITGITLSSLKLLHTFSHLSATVETWDRGRMARLSLEGAATFIRLPAMAAQLERVPRGAELHVDLEQLGFIDHACLELLTTWARQHEASGGRLVMDWDTLHATFSDGLNPGRSRNGKKNGRNGVVESNGSVEPGAVVEAEEGERLPR
jgi:MFS superfamily sulfate permease-like transporter